MTNFTNTNNPKGTSMNREQKANRTSTPNTGLAATLSNLFRAKGTSLPPSPANPSAVAVRSRTARPLRATLAVLALAIAAFAVTVAPASAAPPSVTTPVASDVSYSSVHVEGKVTTDGSGYFTVTTYTFEYCADGLDCAEDANWSVGFQSGFGTSIVGPATDEPVQAPITGLKGGTKYFVRLAANNGLAGEETATRSPEPNPSFTTLTADPPSVEQTDNASEVEYAQAKFSGKVNRPAKSNDLTCNFEYITDVAYLANPAGKRFSGATAIACDPSPVAIEGSSIVSAQPTGLSSSTTYHLRLAVSNASAADAKEASATFTTKGPVPAPSVEQTDNASEVEYSRASLSGRVSRPAGVDPILNTECHFEYITDDTYQANPAGERFSGATPVECQPSLIDAPGPAEVTAQLGGLVPSTTYHLRLSATNAGGTDSKEAASTFTTLGPVPKPLVIKINDATDVGKHSAKVSGEIQRPAGSGDPAFDTSCRFEYVSEEQFNDNPPGEEFAGAGSVDCVEAPLTGTAPDYPAVKAAVSAELTGLPSGPTGTTYHLRLTANNGGGNVSKEAAGTFTTLPIIHPSFTVDSITEVGYSSFKVNGTADPGNQGTFPFFEFSPAGKEEWVGNPIGRFQAIGAGAPAKQVSFTFPCSSGQCDSPKLKPGTTYEVRLGGREEEERSNFFYSPTPYPEFTTKGTSTPPSASCDPVTEITGTSAHISCAVDSHAPAGPLDDEGKAAYKTDWHFECTPACPPGLNGGTVEAEEGSQAIELDVKHLEAKSHYQIKLIAHNALETVESEVTFDTLGLAPTVTALPGGSDGEGGYILAGTVNPNNSKVTSCEFKWGPDSASYAFKADCSPKPGEKGQPVTVEAHLTGLNPGSVYHANLFATNAAGTEESKDFEFTPTLAEPGPECANEQLRKENDSLGLPECRAYEMVTDPNKQGAGAFFGRLAGDFSGGDAVAYESGAPNIAGSGAGSPNAIQGSYVATRTPTGWKTIPNLNGPTGSLYAAPEFTKDPATLNFSADLLSSLWQLSKKDTPAAPGSQGMLYLRRPDGRFVLVGVGRIGETPSGGLASDDLSHVLGWGSPGFEQTPWGPGVYEFVGTGNDQPRRVDLDAVGDAICGGGGIAAVPNAISTDGRVIVLTAQCDGSIWARVDGTTSYKVSASLCIRADCNAPAKAEFRAAAKDGSRVYFTTTQQLVNGDEDQTNDLYACDIPTTPQAPVGTASPCAALHQVSAAPGGKADVQQLLKISDDGSTAYFTARGVLADNEDALGEPALAGDRNLYAWRTDAAHPDGQTTFVARLPESDSPQVQTTSDGRYLLLQTAGQLLLTDTDTDHTTDIYRYDTVGDEMVRVSTAVSGAGGNGDFDARLGGFGVPVDQQHNSHFSISGDGQLIVFASAEPLSPTDGNGEPDAYLWNDGHALGSVAPLVPGFEYGQNIPGRASIDGSGHDIYIQTGARLNPSDVDFAGDIYDVRIGGGFPQRQEGCTGELCQSPGSTPPVTSPSPTDQPNGEGNIKPPKPCPKGRVRKKNGRCVKKHSAKKHSSKKASHKQGGGK